jgi:multidrug efflux pump subunit AcrA (membrane-fusion protein)
MPSIDERIAELEQRIAEKRAYQRLYPSHKYASTWDYVAEGDRSGFDKMDASEAAYRNMLSQQAQQLNVLKAQQEFNARENELNRKNALTIANQNKANEIESKKDEYIRGRNKAASVLNYAQQALSQDPNNIQLQKEAQLAKEDFDYYDRKLDGQGYDNIPVQTVEQSDGLNNNQVNSIVKSIVDKKLYTDADRTKLQVLSEYVNDPTIKEQINTILSNKGKTKEDKDTIKATREEFAKNWKPGQPFDNKIYKQKFKNGKPYLVVR